MTLILHGLRASIRPGAIHREALEPGTFGQMWFEEYTEEVRVDAKGTRRVRVRIKPNAKPKPRVCWVTARVRYRTPTGGYRELSRSGDTKGKAERVLKRLIEARPMTGTSSSVQPTWTIEQLANHWLDHRRATGLAHAEGKLRSSSLRQLDVTIRTTILGDRKTLVDGTWQVTKREGGIPCLRISECSHAVIEAWLVSLEAKGLSTKQVRAVLRQMLDLAVRDGALQGNPMSAVTKPSRRPRTTRRLGVENVRLLRTLVTPAATRKTADGRMQNVDLAEVVDFTLGTGCRIGEVLAVRWCDLHLDAEIPYVVVCGTLIEPRDGVAMDRAPQRKNDPRDADSLVVSRLDGDEPDLTLFLPTAVVEMLRERHCRLVEKGRDPAADEVVFASAKGTVLHPSNIRTRLRKAVEGTSLEGIAPHALRKAVATLVADELGMEAARHQMGHADPSLTGRIYVQDSMLGPDVRNVLKPFFDAEWKPVEHVVLPRMPRRA